MKLLRFITILLWITIQYKDAKGNKKYKFNIRNPVGWVLLLIVCVVSGIIAGVKEGYKLATHTLEDALGE
jgi:hypothetical protein